MALVANVSAYKRLATAIEDRERLCNIYICPAHILKRSERAIMSVHRFAFDTRAGYHLTLIANLLCDKGDEIATRKVEIQNAHRSTCS